VYKYVEVCHNCQMKKFDKHTLVDALSHLGLLALGGVFICGMVFRPDVTVLVTLAALLTFKEKVKRYVC